jgi:hypothetical protein
MHNDLLKSIRTNTLKLFFSLVLLGSTYLTYLKSIRSCF